MSGAIGDRLEQYTLRHPREVLLVTATWPDPAGSPITAEIIVFKGFSSSLTAATASDPDIPVLPADATILKADRLASPYRPDNPQYIQPNLTGAELEKLLQEAGC
jgi:hypothetical protein